MLISPITAMPLNLLGPRPQGSPESMISRFNPKIEGPQSNEVPRHFRSIIGCLLDSGLQDDRVYRAYLRTLDDLARIARRAGKLKAIVARKISMAGEKRLDLKEYIDRYDSRYAGTKTKIKEKLGIS